MYKPNYNNGKKKGNEKNMALQNKILQLMKEQNLNQKQLATKASITEASMSKYLSGERTPRIDVVVKLAKALDTSVSYLLDNEPAPDDPYAYASTALARCKGQLTDAEKKRLMMFLLED